MFPNQFATIWWIIYKNHHQKNSLRNWTSYSTSLYDDEVTLFHNLSVYDSQSFNCTDLVKKRQISGLKLWKKENATLPTFSLDGKCM